MMDQVKLEAFYPDPPEQVWKALTDPDLLKQWLMPTDFEALVGFRFRFERTDGSLISGRVTDVEERRLLAYTWEDDNGEESLVVWQLSPKDGGTALRLDHIELEAPAVTRIPIDAYFNWRYALRHNLPGLLELLRAVFA